jgi:hypothetical protein
MSKIRFMLLKSRDLMQVNAKNEKGAYSQEGKTSSSQSQKATLYLFISISSILRMVNQERETANFRRAMSPSAVKEPTALAPRKM